jgi:phosphotransferase system enzyme I (PtsI)
LYVDRRDPPGEEEQYQTYKRVVEKIAPHSVTLRTFDIGGDKFVSAFRVPAEMNPALGLRAVRLGLEWPDLFKTQLRAMIRASADGSVRIMIPLVSSLVELRKVKELMAEAYAEVAEAGHKHATDIPLGVMIEVPGAALMADEFAKEAEFMSIGTNDLVQYTLAVDRTSQKLAHLANAFDPAILRLIRMVVAAGKQHERPVAVCGAMASDPLAAILLVGMGIRELSMEATAVSEIKEALVRIDLKEAEAAAREALLADTAHGAEQALQRFAPRIADLLDPDDGLATAT